MCIRDREADHVLYTLAGPEIAVATTKAYSTQLAACYLIALRFAQARGTIDGELCAALVAELQTLPEKIARVLEDKERLQWFASKYAGAKDVFFLGRGVDYAVAMEGSLKMKEISYIPVSYTHLVNFVCQSKWIARLFFGK